MYTYKITFSNGDSFITGFNGDLSVATKYYMNNVFNLGVVDDLMVRAVKIEECA